MPATSGNNMKRVQSTAKRLHLRNIGSGMSIVDCKALSARLTCCIQGLMGLGDVQDARGRSASGSNELSELHCSGMVPLCISGRMQAMMRLWMDGCCSILNVLLST